MPGGGAYCGATTGGGADACSTTPVSASVETRPINRRAWKIAYDSWGA